MRATREQVIAYRVVAHQFDRAATRIDDLAVLDLGVQDAAGEQARLAFDARLATTPPGEPYGTGKPLALVWSLRGAPHVHRRDDLDALTRALYPQSEQDAAVRLNETGPSLARAGITALDQYVEAATQLRRAVTRPTAKGAASTAVSKAIPTSMLRECRSCGTRHVSDSAMRGAALPAGLELEPRTSPPVLVRRTGTRLVTEPDATALSRLIDGYLRLLGPATATQVAGYLGARRADVAQAWPDDLVEVSVAGQKRYLPAGRADALADAPPPDLVRLLGGNDPYLQARDRELVVPDAAARKLLWPVLGKPGAVLADGEVVGLWRVSASGTKLTVKVEPFGALPKPVWAAVQDEAERVAAVRDLTLAGVTRV